MKRSTFILILLIASSVCFAQTNGRTKNYHENGMIESEGIMKDEKREGEWKYYTEEGVLIKKQYYKNDLLSGISTTYYSNGRIESKEYYKNDLLDGDSYYYDLLGNITSKAVMKEGVGELTEYYETGEVKAVSTLKFWKWPAYYMEDEAREFYKSGKIKTIKHFFHESEHGELKKFYESGKLYADQYYNYGSPINEWKAYYENGKLFETINFIEGPQFGSWVNYSEEGSVIAKGKVNESEQTNLPYLGIFPYRNFKKNIIELQNFINYFTNDETKIKINDKINKYKSDNNFLLFESLFMDSLSKVTDHFNQINFNEPYEISFRFPENSGHDFDTWEITFTDEYHLNLKYNCGMGQVFNQECNYTLNLKNNTSELKFKNSNCHQNWQGYGVVCETTKINVKNGVVISKKTIDE